MTNDDKKQSKQYSFREKDEIIRQLDNLFPKDELYILHAFLGAASVLVEEVKMWDILAEKIKDFKSRQGVLFQQDTVNTTFGQLAGGKKPVKSVKNVLDNGYSI